MEDTSDSMKVYIAESISDKRETDGRLEYFIKWKGWSARFSTWEPADNVLDLKLIDDFNKRYGYDETQETGDGSADRKSAGGAELTGKRKRQRRNNFSPVHFTRDWSVYSRKRKGSTKPAVRNANNQSLTKKSTDSRNGKRYRRNTVKRLPNVDAEKETSANAKAASRAALSESLLSTKTFDGASQNTSYMNEENTSPASSKKIAVTDEQLRKAYDAIAQHEKAAMRKVQLPYPFHEMMDDDDGIHPDAVQYFVIPRSDGTTFRVRMCKNKELLLRTRKRAP